MENSFLRRDAALREDVLSSLFPLPREAIVVHLVGGLGNQLFQYAAVGAAADRAGRPLYLDPSGLPGGRTELTAFPVAASLLNERQGRALPSPGDPRPWRRRRLGVHRVVEERFGFGAQLEQLPARAWVSGYWQSPLYFRGQEDRLRSTFHVSNVRLSRTAQGVLASIADAPTVAVQVRRGDYVKNPETAQAHGVVDEQWFAAAIDLAVAELGWQIMVFSNDVEWCRAHLDIPGARFVGSRPDAPAYEDLLLIAACRRHVISNSSYGWWGAWLADSEHVVAPSQWTVDARYDTSTLLPEGWVRL